MTFEGSEKALCRFLPPELFDWGPAVQMRQARDVCFQCPVRDECADDAVLNGSGDMIRGGYVFKDKQGRMRNQRKMVIKSEPPMVKSEESPTDVGNQAVVLWATLPPAPVSWESPDLTDYRHDLYGIGWSCQRSEPEWGWKCTDSECVKIFREGERLRAMEYRRRQHEDS